VTRRKKQILAAVALSLVVLGAAIAGAVRYWPHGPAGVPPELVPTSWNEYRTSPGHRTHVDGGKAACKDCHDYTRDGFKNPGSAPCARCHAKEASHMHAGDAAKKTECLTCHVFSPNTTPPTCIGCHAVAEGPLAAVHVHATADCASCHHVHEDPPIAPAACASCHDERATEHGRHAGTRGCMDCHTGHAPAAAAIVSCSTCHAQPAGPKPAGHDSCIGCHAPHDFVASNSGCVGCHGPKPTLLASTVHAHTLCTNCHTPHSPEKAAESCSGCHTGIKVEHGSKDACVTCHEPHGEKADTTMASTCTSCHAKVALSDTSAHAGGVACVGCHKPHDFDPPDRRTLCAGCHASEAALAGASKGHTDCSTCHGGSTHKPTAAPACGTCHKPEQASAPPGHQKCTGCHEPHKGTVLPQAACASCHANKASGPHATIQGGCTTCHRPHGPDGVATPPVCTTCHAREKLPALHAIPAHADCASCHVSHEAPHADRATCTGPCHVDRRDHQPQAKVCDGCHVFRQ
jgi:hypothetical protein